jgi:hypothetical protein
MTDVSITIDGLKLEYFEGKDLIYPSQEDYYRYYFYYLDKVILNAGTKEDLENAIQEALKVHPLPEVRGYRSTSDKEAAVTKHLGQLGYSKYRYLLPDYKTDVSAYNKKRADRLEQFKLACFKELGVADHPKRDLLWSKAKDRASGEGLYGIYNSMSDLVDLIMED